MKHKARMMYICDCGFRTRDLEVLLFHTENPNITIGREKLMEITNGRT